MCAGVGKYGEGCYTGGMRKLDTGKPPKQSRSKRSPLVTALLCLLACGMAFCAYQVGSILLERSRGRELNREMKQFITFRPAAPATEEDPEPVGPTLSVDFDALQQKNADICAWIAFPDTEINYPVVQGSDNAYYLSRTASGDKNSCGAIFVDAVNARDFSNAKTIVYGHRMNNGSMFAGLLKYRDAAYFAAHPYGLLATPEQTYVLEVFAAGEVADDLANYRTSFADAEDFLADIRMLRGGAVQQTELTIGAEDRVVMLSTCVKGDHSKRFVVLARLVPYGDYVFA